MIKGEQKKGCEKILKKLGRGDLVALCDTVTCKHVAPESAEEAIEAILRYSKSAEELLNRKKLKHEVVLQYLYSANAEDISPKSTKAELVSKTLSLWRRQSSASGELRNQTPRNTPTNITINHTTVIHSEIRNYTSVVAKPPDEMGQLMAKEFIEWFYPMLNSVKDPGETSWSANHFWPDSCLALSITNEGNQTRKERFEGANRAQEKLSSLVKQERVIFNPNMTTEGYRGAISPHGLAKVAVCGTIHKLDACQPSELAGIFEQCFGLMRDIGDGNRWKIKLTNLKIKITQSFGQMQQITLSEEALQAISE